MRRGRVERGGGDEENGLGQGPFAEVVGDGWENMHCRRGGFGKGDKRCRDYPHQENSIPQLLQNVTRLVALEVTSTL